MKIFDTHAHYDDDAFDEDREKLLNESFGAGKTVCNIANIGCDIESSRESVRLAERYDYMYAVVGVIPHHVGDMTEADLEELRRLAKESKKFSSSLSTSFQRLLIMNRMPQLTTQMLT